jgi:hypothetical protein
VVAGFGEPIAKNRCRSRRFKVEMKNKNYFLVSAVVLALAAGLAPRAHAQEFDTKYGKWLILSGGTSTTNTYSIFAPTLTSEPTFTFPAANIPAAAGILFNDGTGVLTWPATVLDPTDLAPGANLTYLVTNASGVVQWSAVNVDTTLNGNGIPVASGGSTLGINLAHSDTWTAAQSVSIAVTPADAMILANTTPATALLQLQYPPRLRLSGQGWATAGSEDVDWILQAIPVAGTTAPTSYLDFEDGLSNTGYSTNFEIFSSGGSTLGISTPTDPGVGVLNVATGLQVNGAAAAGALLIGNSSGIFVPTSVTYPPSVGAAGNVVRANSTGTAFISTPPNIRSYTPATSYTTGSGNSGEMMGLGDTISPAYSGKVLIIVTGNMFNSTTATGTVQLHYGTTTPPPSANAGPTGTAVGTLVSETSQNAANHWFFSTSALVEGLTINPTNPIWVDLEVSSSSGTTTVNDVTVSIEEF